MRFIDRLWKRLSGGEAAERAELEGDLNRAVRLWMAAGAVDEAARVMALRGDAEADPKARLQHYAQAVATATPGSASEKAARAKKARLTVSLAQGGALSPAVRRDVTAAAEDLERAGDAVAAAEAYALAGDTEGEARALAQGGEVERLENLLSRDQDREKRGRLAHEAHAEIDGLIAAGQRRDALALAEGYEGDPVCRSRVTRLRGARTLGPIVRLTVYGRRFTLVLGEAVTIGRTEGTISVASSALSRRHAELSRENGAFVVSDLGSRNGTQLRGQNVTRPLPVAAGLTLTLGGEVPLTLSPSSDFADALAVDVAGTEYVAPLGDAKLGVGSWRLAVDESGWVELITEGTPDAFVRDMVMARRVTLLRGDALSCERGAEAVLRIEE